MPSRFWIGTPFGIEWTPPPVLPPGRIFFAALRVSRVKLSTSVAYQSHSVGASALTVSKVTLAASVSSAEPYFEASADLVVSKATLNAV